MTRKYNVHSRKTHEMPCELCKAKGALVQRLNPLNWHQETRRLCTRHRKELGYHPIKYDRGGYGGGTLPGK